MWKGKTMHRSRRFGTSGTTSRRELLSLLAAGSVLPLLAACGGAGTASRTSALSVAGSASASSAASSAGTLVRGQASSSGASSATAGAPSATVAPAAAAGSGAAQLRFVTWGGVDETKVRQTYTDQFNKDHQSIKVTFAPHPQDYWNALQSQMAGGEGPDVYYLEPGYVVELQCRNALLALDSYIQRDKFDLTDFYPDAIKEYTIAGKLWALARDFANQDIAYNVDLFKQKGVPLPPKRFDAAGWTYNDFLLACQKLTGGSGPTKVWGFGVPTGFRPYMAYVWSNGGAVVSGDATKPAVDQPNTVEALQFLEDLIGKYEVAPKPADLKGTNLNNLFFSGQLGMVTALPAGIAQFRAGVKGFQWDVAPPPLGPHGTKRQVGGGGAGFGVYGQTKYPDQSWQFMQWITGIKAQEQEVDANTSMGSRLSVGAYFVKVNQGKDPQNVQMFVDASKNFLHTDPHASNWLEVQAILGKELKGIWDASKPAKDAAAEAARQMAPLLGQPCGT
jgi:multiple sugar transport system substrate-binding protein